ncbi:MAG TPA: hypothetical protein VFT22_37355, partial [Kofleriaceae bacterium]|nr:hypothetical protein [Kofleriaceae bacterium]
IARKRRVLASLGGESAHHRTVELDALAGSGERSLAAVCATLDPALGTAILTEGLINYFERDDIVAMWRRFAAQLQRFPHGLYLSDMLLGDDNRGPVTTGFGWLLSAFVRGRVHLPFATAEQVEDALEEAGLVGVALDPRDFAFELEGLEAAGAGRVRVLEAAAQASRAETAGGHRSAAPA